MTVTITENIPLASRAEPIEYRATRILLGWLPEPEAVPMLLGRNPVPDDDLGEIKDRAARARAAVQNRKAAPTGDPVIRADRSLLDQAAARAELRASFPDVTWTTEWVDMTRVRSIQKMITTENLELRVADVGDDLEALVGLCLPAGQPGPAIGAFTDQDGLGFTFSSPNPNLRFVAAQLHEAEVALSPGVPSQKVQAITFLVAPATSYVQIARYRDRYILRDGYHRVAGLLRAGITQIPAIVIDAPTFQYVAPTPGLFDYEIAFSGQAPLVTDFWDDEVSADTRHPAVRTVLRVQAQRFAVQG